MSNCKALSLTYDPSLSNSASYLLLTDFGDGSAWSMPIHDCQDYWYLRAARTIALVGLLIMAV